LPYHNNKQQLLRASLMAEMMPQVLEGFFWHIMGSRSIVSMFDMSCCIIKKENVVIIYDVGNVFPGYPLRV
jgi:hypothetical protein